jgi:hypothetical protein
VTAGQDSATPLGGVLAGLIIAEREWATRAAGGTPLPAGEAGMSSADVTEYAGISYRRLDLWVSAGYLRPVQVATYPKAARGSGLRRRWPAIEAEIARRMARLAGAGFELEAAARFARDLWPAAEIAPGITLKVTP